MRTRGTSWSGTQKTVQWLALGAIAGAVLFTLAWIALGRLRPGYSPVSRPISALGVGPSGAFMRAAFVLNGLLVFGGVLAAFRVFKFELGAVGRWLCVVTLALSPLGILWAGIFTMDRLALHTIGAFVAIGTPVIAFPVVGLSLRRAPNWQRFGTLMLLGGPLTLALLVGFTQSVPQSELHTGAGGGSYGLWERALVIEVQAWYVAMGWLVFRRSRRSATP